jgi:nucleoside-diphosphate-sugar epimerase
MTNDILILGYGVVGKATAERLLQQGRPVRIGQRKKPHDLLDGANFVECDVLNATSLEAAAQGASQIVACFGFEYTAQAWRENWPKAMANLIAVCERQNARLVFFDNLYMYGPQDGPLHEDLPLTDYGIKPKIRADITRMWQTASAQGTVNVAAVRAPDFYGPNVHLSHFGDESLGKIAQGKAGRFLLALDQPHDVAYVPDCARAIVTLLDAPDDAFGQAWHVPVAPTQTPRQLVAMAGKMLGRKAEVSQIPSWLVAILGLLMPFMRELREMNFISHRPYRVDASKFSKRFWSNATPFEVGLKATLESFNPGITVRQ